MREQTQAGITRRQNILDAAIEVAVDIGFNGLLRDNVAKQACAASGSINYHFGEMNNLKDEVIKHAIKTAPSDDRMLRIIAQGVMADNEFALSAPRDLKRLALNSMA